MILLLLALMTFAVLVVGMAVREAHLQKQAWRRLKEDDLDEDYDDDSGCL